jgi:hypothetical protein
MRILHISEVEINKQVGEIFKPIKYGENTVGVCYPGCKIYYNLTCFLDSPKILKSELGKYYQRYIFVTLYLSNDPTTQEIVNIIAHEVFKSGIALGQNPSFDQICDAVIENGRELHLFFLDAHTISRDKLDQLLDLLYPQFAKSNKIHGTLFFEENIYKEELYSILKAHHIFLQNISFFPTYSSKESQIFLKNVVKEWKLKISVKKINDIAGYCGGYLWLLKEALKICRDSNNISIQEVINRPSMKFRLDSIYSLFTPEEKNDLYSIVNNKSKTIDPNNLLYFTSVGILSLKKNRLILSLPLLSNLIKSDTTTKKIKLYLVNGNIIYKDKDITLEISPSEIKILTELIKKKNQLITRESLAQIIWEKDWIEKYSDWALDKLISRLRSSLSNLGLPKNILIVKKGRGVILRI